MKRARRPISLWVLGTAWAMGCSLARTDVQSRVHASLSEKCLASGTGIVVDSVRLGNGKGPAYPGVVYLRSGGTEERDSILVKADLSGLEYAFPAPGSLASRVFR